MEQVQQRAVNVPAELIEQLGTGTDVRELVGKSIRVIDHPMFNCPMEIRGIFGIPEINPGAEGVVIHVDADGDYWADFGDDERAELCRTESANGRRLHHIGTSNPDDAVVYEVLA